MAFHAFLEKSVGINIVIMNSCFCTSSKVPAPRIKNYDIGQSYRELAQQLFMQYKKGNRGVKAQFFYGGIK